MKANLFSRVTALALLAMACPAHADDCEAGVDLSYFLDARVAKTAISSNLQKSSTTLQGIFFTSDYDNGSLQSIAAAGTNVFNGTLFNEDSIDGLGGRRYHFRFRMTGVASRTITINLEYAQTPRPFIRVNNGSWRRMTSAECPGTARTQMVLTFGASENEAEIAFFEPLGYKEINDQVNNLVANGVGATSEVLGLSFQGREQWLVTVTDPAYPASGKRRVWVHARAHSGEVTASHTMLGFLDRITQNNPTAARLRRYCIFHVVPTQNVDGVFLGLTRWDSQGIDPERQWGNPLRIPEVANIYHRVNTYMVSGNPIEIGLNLHSTVSDFTDTFFFKHIRPSVTANFELIQQRYIDALDNATPLFNNFSAQTSQLNATLFIESYFWNNWQELVMAMTHEGHYYERVTSSPSVPGPLMTGNDYRGIGSAMADSVIEYFNLPNPQSGVAEWSLY